MAPDCKFSHADPVVRPILMAVAILAMGVIFNAWTLLEGPPTPFWEPAFAAASPGGHPVDCAALAFFDIIDIHIERFPMLPSSTVGLPAPTLPVPQNAHPPIVPPERSHNLATPLLDYPPLPVED
jgi:hypothetical protein